jgi:hypothetical protein
VQRRQLLKCAGALALLARYPAAPLAYAADIPAEVAGVHLPHSPRALAAAAYARRSCPDYLFNHCMRTFVFGGLQLHRQQRDYVAEEAFIAAALHDLGLLPAFETPRGSFEVDGADAAERWVTEQHGTAAEADRIWHAVQMHDGSFALTRRQGPEAMLVALGAGADVYGAERADIEAARVEEVVAAFPRLKFKQQFTALLVAHCARKPASQHGTWLESLCHEHAPQGTAEDAVEKAIAAAPFAE